MGAEINKHSTPKQPFGSSMGRAFGNRQIRKIRTSFGAELSEQPGIHNRDTVIMDSGLAAPRRSGM